MKAIDQDTIEFHQIFPEQPLPTLASASTAEIPKRAKHFCLPFNTAMQRGVLLYPPINFQVKLEQDQLQLKLQKEDGSDHCIRIQKNSEEPQITYLLLQDQSTEQSERALSFYREKLVDTDMPDWLDRNDFGFYEIMVNALYEPDVDTFYLQIWLGGALKTAPGQSLWFKQPTNHPPYLGYTHLDAIIKTDQWHGWLATVIRIDTEDEWISIKRDTPLSQAFLCEAKQETLTTIPSSEVSSSTVSLPVEWHILDPSYGRKPGKYQRTYSEE